MMGMSREERRGFYIQKNIDYYINKFTKMQMSVSSVSWNWCAFLFSSYWLIYRKMYKEFAIVAALEVFTIPAAASLLEPLGSLTLLVSIFTGLFGNYLYMKHIDRLIDNEPVEEEIRLDEYRNKTGGTTYYVWIYLGIVAVLNMVLPFA